MLVATDDPTVGDRVAAALRDRHAVRVAHGGEAALRRLNDPVDVALIDRQPSPRSPSSVSISSPDGSDSCRRAALTAAEPDADPADRPFDDYLVTPVDPEDVRSAVDRLLRRNAYDEKIEELYALATKRAALAAAEEERELVTRTEREVLRTRFERLDAELVEPIRSLDAREAFEIAAEEDRGRPADRPFG